jgi:hypothetical protein
LWKTFGTAHTAFALFQHFIHNSKKTKTIFLREGQKNQNLSTKGYILSKLDEKKEKIASFLEKPPTEKIDLSTELCTKSPNHC